MLTGFCGAMTWARYQAMKAQGLLGGFVGEGQAFRMFA